MRELLLFPQLGMSTCPYGGLSLAIAHDVDRVLFEE